MCYNYRGLIDFKKNKLVVFLSPKTGLTVAEKQCLASEFLKKEEKKLEQTYCRKLCVSREQCKHDP